jgi:hypothetical protein
MSRTLIHTTTLAILALAAACSDAPRSVPVTKTASGMGGGTKSGELPANHPPIGNTDASAHAETDSDIDPTAQFSGKVILVGELAKKHEGAVFISVRPVSGRTPFLSYKVDLATAKAPVLVDAADGTRELHFVLNASTSMMPGNGVPKDVPLEVQVMYSPGGFVDTKDGQTSAVTPAKSGDADLVLTLKSNG